VPLRTPQLDDGLREHVAKNLESFQRKALALEGRRPAAVALVLVGDAARRPCFVLTRRASRLKDHGGQWALPGGGIDADETPERTALRELEEEVGLSLSRRDVLGLLDDFATRSGFVITPVVVWGADAGPMRPNPREVAAAFQIPIARGRLPRPRHACGTLRATRLRLALRRGHWRLPMPPRKTLAMVQTANRKLEPRELPVPEIGDDDALLRVEACGICGSDYEQYEGVLRTPVPVIPGHEPLGVIERIGDTAARRWGVDVGDRVAVETMLPCHNCPICLRGDYHLCRQRRIYSYIPLEVAPGLWGAYSEYMYLGPTSIVHKVDAALAPQLAVIFNPLGCREVGAGTIIVTGLEADRRKLELAREFGADHTIDVENETPKQRIRELTDGRGADVVVDVSSYATAPVAEALDYAAPGGRVVLAGVKGFKPIPDFVSDKIVMKEIKILGAIGVTWSGYDAAIRLIESRKVPLEKMHTHDFGLREAELAIRTLAREIPNDESIHSCLIPGLAG
jgi:threonine dehydrogenase-like Zn-dependent dehydrogenase/8-oxo-dGTP pyrophosphatase MutT (NUDIX family)